MGERAGSPLRTILLKSCGAVSSNSCGACHEGALQVPCKQRNRRRTALVRVPQTRILWRSCLHPRVRARLDARRTSIACSLSRKIVTTSRHVCGPSIAKNDRRHGSHNGSDSAVHLPVPAFQEKRRNAAPPRHLFHPIPVTRSVVVSILHEANAPQPALGSERVATHPIFRDQDVIRPRGSEDPPGSSRPPSKNWDLGLRWPRHLPLAGTRR